MRIKFVGAVEHLTGSCSWLHYSKTDTQFLVDCGMHQGVSVEQLNRSQFPFDPQDIYGVLLTHAHLDHCGLIPKLYREGFTGKVYTTAATAKLAKIVLMDAANINQQQSPPLYTREDVDLIEFYHVDDRSDFVWGKAMFIAPGVTASFLLSSHILGAASISVSWSEDPQSVDDSIKKTMMFSGDIGNNTEENSYLPLIKSNKHPFPNTSYILVESTYGGRIREPKFKCEINRQNALNDVLTQTLIDKKGKVIIPTFSIHRSQEILIDLVVWLKRFDADRDASGASPKPFRILCHSAMTAKANQIYFEELNREITTKKGRKKQYLSNDFNSYIGEDDAERTLKHLFNTIEPKRKGGAKACFRINQHKIEVVSRAPKELEQGREGELDYDIIIASSGMCDAGPICHYLNMYENNPDNAILITGYQAKGSRGDGLLDYVDQESEAHAEVFNLSPYYSGHADQAILLDYIFNLGGFCSNNLAATVFINHGESSGKEALKSAIETQAAREDTEQRLVDRVVVAESSVQWFNLSTGKYELETEPDDIGSSTAGLEKDIKTLVRGMRELKLMNQRILDSLPAKK